MKLSLGLTPRDYSVAGGTVVYDTDAQAYFTANTAITSDADKNAINTFYLGLKSDGIYTKIKAMYLPIWGSASACKWNLVNPLDTNAAFRLNFSTGWTFSSGGALPNGTSAYANTFLVPSVDMVGKQNNMTISAYIRTNNNGSYADLGSSNLGFTNISLLMPRTTDLFNGGINNNANTNIPNTDSRGFFLIKRTSSTTVIYQKNSTQTSKANTSSGLSNVSFYLGAMHEGTNTVLYSVNQGAFYSIGDGLTDAEATNFYTRVNTLMTYFGINV